MSILSKSQEGEFHRVVGEKDQCFVEYGLGIKDGPYKEVKKVLTDDKGSILLVTD